MSECGVIGEFGDKWRGEELLGGVSRGCVVLGGAVWDYKDMVYE
jgi:hypothetical protein